MNLRDEKIKAAEEVHREFEEILRHEKCRTCACLYSDMMTSILGTLRELNETESHESIRAAERDFSGWMAEGETEKLHH